MIVHDKNLLNNLYLIEAANSLQAGGFISKEQNTIIKKNLSGFKRHDNILVRLGFFLLGSFLYVSICGTFSLLGIDSGEVFWKICFYLFAIVGFAGTNILANQKYYAHGLDDAFNLGALLNIGIAIGITTDGYEIGIAFFIAVASFLMYLRYIHLPSALIFCLASSAVIFYGMFEFGIVGKTILPFIMLLCSGCGYLISKKRLENLTVPYYYNGLKLTKGFSLILFYLVGNYYVVRELNANLSQEYYYNNVSPEIPFALFFWALTVIIPIVYLVYSLKNKDRIMLWIGFLALCFSIFSFRMYHHVLPPEAALTIGGLALFTFTYFAIKKTKYKETGITFKADRFSDPNAFSNLQTLAAASQFGLKPEAKVEESPMEYGGGGFSGGGSGSSF